MLIRHAAIQLALSPIGKLVSHSEVKRLLLRDKVSKAESMIRQIRDLAKDQSAECLMFGVGARVGACCFAVSLREKGPRYGCERDFGIHISPCLVKVPVLHLRQVIMLGWRDLLRIKHTFCC